MKVMIGVDRMSGRTRRRCSSVTSTSCDGSPCEAVTARLPNCWRGPTA
jgi:hypothetical protein